MFGYIRPLVPDLKVGDYQYYKAAYCGLCRRMGKVCGKASRLCLSYDMVFLFLLRSYLCSESHGFEKHVCRVNPLVKKKMLSDSESLRYASAVSGILAALRFRDDVSDERGFRRFGAKCGAGVSIRWLKRADRLYPGLAAGIEERLGRLYEKEKSYAESGEQGPAADECAGLFGEALAYVCSYGLEDDRAAFAIASAVGKYVGRWNYLVDAADDLSRDAEKGRFNPFLISYGRHDLSDDEKNTLACLLAAEAGAAADAFALAENGDGDASARRIILNVLVKGMPLTSDEVLAGTYRKPGHDGITAE